MNALKISLIFILTLKIFAEVSIDGLIAYFPLTGNADDYSGNGHICTVTGAVLTTDRVGRENDAYSFDGTNDKIVGNANTMFELANNRTLSVWVLSSGLGNQQIVGYVGENGHMGYMLGVREDGTFTSWENNYNDTTGLWVHVSSDQIYAGDNKWHHLVGLRRNDTTYLYVDNVRQSKTTILKPIFVKNSNILIGTGKKNTFQNFNGKIDDIRFYNRSLTDEEISYLYFGTNSIKFKTKFNVSHNNLHADIKCFDLRGRIIYKRSISNGVYILKLRAEKKIFQIK